MAGLPKKEIRVYNNKGEFIEEFSSIIECRKSYFKEDKGKRPLLTKNISFFSLYKNKMLNIKYGYINNFYFFDETVNRDDIRFLDKIRLSDFCKKIDYNQKPVEVYNLLNEKIAEFKSQRLLLKCMPQVSEVELSHDLNKITKHTHRHTGSKLNLYFKYK